MATTKATTTPASAKPAAKKPAVKKPAVKKPAAKKAEPKKSKLGAEALYKMTEVAAYYIALNDSFSGNPSEYWLQAEIQISNLHKQLVTKALPSTLGNSPSLPATAIIATLFI